MVIIGRRALATMLLILGISSASEAEYMIYLKGGHFIVADYCTFSNGPEIGKRSEAREQPMGVVQPATDLGQDCNSGKPKGRISWSTIDGSVGEVNADDVYAVFGAKGLPPVKPSSVTMPLEDYLITNRGESVVNVKSVEQRDAKIYGLKRDEPAEIDRRSVIEIAPESAAKSRSGEGLCPGEAIEFAVSDVELVEGHLVGTVTNLSKEPWRPRIDVEVRVKRRLMGKFPVEDPNLLESNDSILFDSQVSGRFLKELERLKDPEAGVRLCYRKVKTAAKRSTAEQAPPTTLSSPK